MKKYLVVFTFTVVILAGLACAAKEESKTLSEVYAGIEVKHRGTMWFKLYPDKATNVSAQFVKLANEGFYDGLLVWRIGEISKGKTFIQSGCPNNDGTGIAPGGTIKEEIDTTLHHKKGTLSMTRFNQPWTTSCQYLVARGEIPEFDGIYTVIGELIRGEEVLDSIEKNDTIVTISIQEGAQ